MEDKGSRFDKDQMDWSDPYLLPLPRFHLLRFLEGSKYYPYHQKPGRIHKDSKRSNMQCYKDWNEEEGLDVYSIVIIIV